MFGDGALAFQEFVMHEKLPLAVVHDAVMAFLEKRADAVLFGAQAVNAYVAESRMTQDVDIMSVNAVGLANDLCVYLKDRFHVEIRIREVSNKRGFRLYQVQKSGNRHLVAIRMVEALPPHEKVAGINVVAPAEIIAHKVIAYHNRRYSPKAGTDWRDIAMLLLQFPELKKEEGEVHKRLESKNASVEVLNTWLELVKTDIQPEEADDDFNF